MKEVIERMLKVEEEARVIIAEAEKRAGEIAERARREADERGEKIRSDAHAEAAGHVDQTRLELNQKRNERLSRVDQVNTGYAGKVRERFAGAIDLVVRRVIGD